MRKDRLRVWWKSSRPPHTMDDLTVDARIVLGILGSCCNATKETFALVLNVPQYEANRFVNYLKYTRSKIIRHLREYGLPAEYGAEFRSAGGHRLLCKKCHQPLHAVPCIMCECNDRPKKPMESELPGMPQCETPTDFPPGSKRKIEVMRRRVENGFSPFHESDALRNLQGSA